MSETLTGESYEDFVKKNDELLTLLLARLDKMIETQAEVNAALKISLDTIKAYLL